MQNGFQLNTSQLFLTYPECSIDKSQALSILRETIKSADNDILQYIVASELHANGHQHLHCYFKLVRAFRTTNPRVFDLQDNHGNYQGCRSAKAVIKYCTKEEDYLSNIDVGTLLSSKSNRVAIARRLLNEDLVKVIQDEPQLLFGYSKLKLDLTILKEDMEPEKPDLPVFLPNPWGKVLLSFRHSKRRHYWIWSRQPNKGKSYHFARPLADEFRAVIQSGDFTYWNVGKHTQLIIIDEYNHALLKYSALNSMCDGTYCFKVIYRGLINIEKFLVIILSNQPICEMYPNMNALLYERFNEIEL